MHQPIRDGLEDYLAGKKGCPGEFTQHLDSCPECAAEVGLMKQQSSMLGTLRTSMEPSAGFYARVLQRIEQQPRPSIWTMMLDPSFGRRIAVGCAMATVVLGAYLIGTEPGDQHWRAQSATVETRTAAPQESLAAQQSDRDDVLVTLASFREN
jgi:anti-sigma factor RsiW